MFFILIKNYIRAWFDTIGFSQRIRRVKHTFYFGDHKVYLDIYCAFPRSFIKVSNSYDTEIIKRYNYLIKREYDNWKIIIDTMVNRPDLVTYKSVKDFVEVVILSDRNVYGISTIINKIDIKTISDIRDEKINKLLDSK